MIETEELCWRPGFLEDEGEVYSSRFTCPKCGHWERANFRLKFDENGREIKNAT